MADERGEIFAILMEVLPLVCLLTRFSDVEANGNTFIQIAKISPRSSATKRTGQRDHFVTVNRSQASRTESFTFSHVDSPRCSYRSQSVRRLGSMSSQFFPRYRVAES